MTIQGLTQAQADKAARLSSLEAEEASLLAYLDDSRYHLDIAQETGQEVWPEITKRRAEARARIAEIRKEATCSRS